MASSPAVEYIAHRGAKREHPENTLAAFARALELGADAVELDVHRTADGCVIVHHDPDVRTGSALGRAELRPIDSMRLAELRDTAETLGHEIPTLDATLDLLAGRATAYVEIKGFGIAEDVLAVVSRHSCACAVHSFDHGAIRQAARIAPDVPRGLLFDRGLERLERAAADSGSRDIWPHWSLINEALMERIAAIGGRALAWTVNDRAESERLISAGAAGLCGDDVRIFPAR
jgi:glycerophosphoryl diester phosphodiesterase